MTGTQRPTLHLLVPGSLEQRTGGYLYDAKIVAGLRERGWRISVHGLAGSFPRADDSARESASTTLQALPDGAFVLLDGLGFDALAPLVPGHGLRLRLVGLVHHLVSDELGGNHSEYNHFRNAEIGVLEACEGVIVTSEFTADRLVALGLGRERIRVVEPGTESARPAAGPDDGDPPLLLCVGAVTPRKGHDTLVRALGRIPELEWRCVCAGSLERDSVFYGQIQRSIDGAGLTGRIRLVGECDAEELDRLYQVSTAVVLPTRFEGYGMALTEALARGLPVVSTTAGAVPSTVPREASILVPPDDDEALADALTTLLADSPEPDPKETSGAPREAGPSSSGRPLRARLSEAALRYADELPDWSTSIQRFEATLLDLAPELPAPEPREPGRGRFAPSWLSLREAADHRSRPEALLRPLVTRWTEEGWSRVLDLGSGAGSNLRYLVPRLPNAQHWTVVDRDADLLELQAGASAAAPTDDLTVVPLVGDLAEEGLACVERAHLVTGSALLDLVSESWLRALVAVCREARCGVLFALTYDGETSWSSADDGFVRELVNQHQRRDKGLGPALGPTAPRRAQELLEEAGLRTWTAQSPWRLGAADADLAGALVRGWVEAALEERPADSGRVRAWGEERQREIRSGDFLLTVGHVDLLALPA